MARQRSNPTVGIKNQKMHAASDTECDPKILYIGNARTSRSDADFELSKVIITLIKHTRRIFAGVSKQPFL